MKLRKTFGGKCSRQQGLVSGLSSLGAAVALLLPASYSRASDDLVVHEWGTFTSVQGADGVLMPWRPLENSALPGFIYNWRQPGLGRQADGLLGLGKGLMTSLQRMETPVIYFYSDKPQMVNATVKFPEGLITEWYPQAAQIGPSKVVASSKLDRMLMLSCGTPVPAPTMKPSSEQSQATWANVYLLGRAGGAGQAVGLAQDSSGKHYFAARETDSSLLRIGALDPSRPMAETERFLFYRGTGNFATPLRVSSLNGQMMLSNTAQEPITKVFILELNGQGGSFQEVNGLARNENKIVSRDASGHVRSLIDLRKQVSAELVRGLVGPGLFEREAQAMVKTWDDSWFAEEGTRVLYILPREWTDRTLPLTITPQPSKMVRVMVGRAEIIS